MASNLDNAGWFINWKNPIFVEIPFTIKITLTKSEYIRNYFDELVSPWWIVSAGRRISHSGS